MKSPSLRILRFASSFFAKNSTYFLFKFFLWDLLFEFVFFLFCFFDNSSSSVSRWYLEVFLTHFFWFSKISFIFICVQTNWHSYRSLLIVHQNLLFRIPLIMAPLFPGPTYALYFIGRFARLSKLKSRFVKILCEICNLNKKER